MKVAVKLVNPDNRLKDDAGQFFAPYEVHVVELTPRIKKAIEINALEKIPGHPIVEPAPPKETTAPPKSEKEDGKKK